MTIHLTPEQQQVIGRAIEAGLIKSADEVVGIGVDAIQRRLEEHREPADSTGAEQWLQDFHNWVHSHPTTTPLLSGEAVDRESIYGTRGQ
jgi:Arc/MetJ-type ribon-helix-helix transcriptional regulator